MTLQPESEYLSRKNQRESFQTTIGFVTKVFEHDGTEDTFSNHEVNVQLKSLDEELKRLPIHTEHNGTIYVPQKNDAVEIGFLKGQTQRPFVSNVVYTTEKRAPLARSGQYRQEFGPDEGEKLYFEAERKDHAAGDPNVIRIGKKPDGLSDPTTTVEVDDSGDTPKINIETDGDISLSADGDIIIENGDTPKSVLTEDAVFEYEQRIDTDDGSGGTTTKTTTTVSNGESTSTQID